MGIYAHMSSHIVFQKYDYNRFQINIGDTWDLNNRHPKHMC